MTREAGALRLALGAWPWAVGALPLVYLWWLLINQLRVPWSTNPQYAYGAAVPFLCAYLLWRRIAQVSPPSSLSAGGEVSIPSPQGSKLAVGCSMLDVPSSPSCPSPVQGSSFKPPPSFSLSVFQLFSFSLLALLFAPTRLIQEANPEWSLVSWALAIEVIGITLFMLPFVLTTYPATRNAHPASPPPFQLSAFVFPICFFLVAVPWPYFIENPVIQGITRLNTALTIEVLGWLKVAALQQGNVIEVRTGQVGIDEACSGIRSLQATLMLSLFFGELYRLKAGRRVLLVLSGFGLAFLFNVGRTTLLTWVAARDGVGAISHWHDPAGVTILVGCFLGLWLVAQALGKAESRKQKAESEGGKAETLKSSGQSSVVRFLLSAFPISVLQGAAFQRVSIFFLAWLAIVELGVALWYRHIEAALPVQPTWQVAWPAEEAGFHTVPIPQKSAEMLHYDEAKQAQWTAANNTQWQMSWFYWKAGKAAGYLAKSHNPLVCMPAVGYSVSAISPPEFADISGLRFPFRIYSFEKEGNTLYVLYSRWDDRAAEQSFATEGVTCLNRLRSVWSGRGNSGQRVISLALWATRDAQGARDQLLRRLRQVLVVNTLQ